MASVLIAAMDTPAFWVFVVSTAGVFGVLVLTLVHRWIDWRHPQ